MKNPFFSNKTNKKIALGVFCALVCGKSFAKELDYNTCVELLGAGIFNQLLENSCNFKGEVSKKLKVVYTAGSCRSTVQQEVVEQTVKDVIADTTRLIQTFGREKFCADNKSGYYALK